MTTTQPPTIDEYPFQVGMVIYRTRQEAEAAVVRALEIYPDARPKIVDRRVAR